MQFESVLKNLLAIQRQGSWREKSRNFIQNQNSLYSELQIWKHPSYDRPGSTKFSPLGSASAVDTCFLWRNKLDARALRRRPSACLEWEEVRLVYVCRSSDSLSRTAYSVNTIQWMVTNLGMDHTAVWFLKSDEEELALKFGREKNSKSIRYSQQTLNFGR